MNLDCSFGIVELHIYLILCDQACSVQYVFKFRILTPPLINMSIANLLILKTARNTCQITSAYTYDGTKGHEPSHVPKLYIHLLGSKF